VDQCTFEIVYYIKQIQRLMLNRNILLDK
jgi:hypothetical protein